MTEKIEWKKVNEDLDIAELELPLPTKRQFIVRGQYDQIFYIVQAVQISEGQEPHISIDGAHIYDYQFKQIKDALLKHYDWEVDFEKYIEE